jgi:hypothetical protein
MGALQIQNYENLMSNASGTKLDLIEELPKNSRKRNLLSAVPTHRLNLIDLIQ